LSVAKAGARPDDTALLAILKINTHPICPIYDIPTNGSAANPVATTMVDK
jgi:hypothetical protein